MAVRNKIFIPNEIYFITFTILGWKKVFTNDKYCSLVYKWFDYLKEYYNNKIYGYVIMPNHIHVLIKITDQSPVLSTVIQNAKRFLAYQIITFLQEDNKIEFLNYFQTHAKTQFGAKHKVFEDRYDSLVIQSEKLFLEKLNYIHKNPYVEKWQLANIPEDYKYSSARNYILGKGFYDIDIMDF
ncbi:transposase [Patescibacteria group bacterium]|nr:transposase [Patescibacteria group bacterium]MBU2416104.1 transposase [Patescibacteria group bacterium]